MDFWVVKELGQEGGKWALESRFVGGRMAGRVRL